MQYEKHPNQALNCNIFRIPFHPLSNRSHNAHHGHNRLESVPFAPVMSVVGGPGQSLQTSRRIDNERADWHDDGTRATTEGWLSPV
jgi:hypothetical protein